LGDNCFGVAPHFFKLDQQEVWGLGQRRVYPSRNMFVPRTERVYFSAEKAIQESFKIVWHPAQRFLICEFRQHYIANIAHQIDGLLVLLLEWFVRLDQSALAGKKRYGRLVQSNFRNDVIDLIEARTLPAHQDVDQHETQPGVSGSRIRGDERVVAVEAPVAHLGERSPQA